MEPDLSALLSPALIYITKFRAYPPSFVIRQQRLLVHRSSPLARLASFIPGNCRQGISPRLPSMKTATSAWPFCKQSPTTSSPHVLRSVPIGSAKPGNGTSHRLISRSISAPVKQVCAPRHEEYTSSLKLSPQLSICCKMIITWIEIQEAARDPSHLLPSAESGLELDPCSIKHRISAVLLDGPMSGEFVLRGWVSLCARTIIERIEAFRPKRPCACFLHVWPILIDIEGTGWFPVSNSVLVLL